MIDAEPVGGAPARAPHASNFDEIDMAGVDPLRIEEVRRRVAAVKSYLEIAEPTDCDRRRHARQLQLSVNQFAALVRAWREHGHAVAMAGAGAARGTPRSAGARTLPSVSKDAARGVVAALGPDVPHVQAVRAVEARCASLGVKSPSKSTIWNMVMSLRRNSARATGSHDIVVSRCHAKLPVEREGMIVFPWIVLAVRASDGVVLAAIMDEESATGDTITAALEGVPASRIVADQEIAKKFLGDLPLHSTVRSSAARTATAKALGRGFGSIDLIYQLSRAIDPQRVLRSRMDTALRPADASGVILKQLTIHNATRGAPPPLVSWQD